MKTQQVRSIYELAEKVGVSYATISRVFNGHSNVAPQTRDAVLKAAAEYNFRPRQQVRKPTIGFVVNLDDHIQANQSGYLDTLTICLINELSKQGVSLEIFTPYNIGNMVPGQIDGFISLPWNEDCLHLLTGQNQAPVVLVNSEPVPGCSSVYCDHFESGSMAADYFCNLGCRRCAIVLDRPDWGNTQRLEGYRQTLTAHGLEWDPRLAGWFSLRSELPLFRQLLEAAPDAIFLGEESHLFEHISAIRTLGGDFPGTLRLMSMENRAVSRFIDPPIPSIKQPLEKMMRQAVKLLLELIRNPGKEPENICISNQLIER